MANNANINFNHLSDLAATHNKILINLQNVYEHADVSQEVKAIDPNPFENFEPRTSKGTLRELSEEVLRKSKFLNEHLGVELTETDG